MEDTPFAYQSSPQLTESASTQQAVTLLQPFIDNPLAIVPIVCAFPALVLLVLAMGKAAYHRYVFHRQVSQLLQVIALERLLYLESDRHC